MGDGIADKNRAEAARIRAEERLQHKQSMHEYYQSKIALNRAMQPAGYCKIQPLITFQQIATVLCRDPAQSGFDCLSCICFSS